MIVIYSRIIERNTQIYIMPNSYSGVFLIDYLFILTFMTSTISSTVSSTMSLRALYRINKAASIKLKSYNQNLIGGRVNNNTINTTDTINEKNLIKYIDQNTKASLRASYDDNGNLSSNVANKGLNVGEIAIRGKGEYGGLAIRALEYIKPILTDQRIIRAIKHLITGDMQKAIGVLRLNEEVYDQGIGIVYAVLKRWLENNVMPVPKEYTDKAITIKSKRFIDWIDSSFNWAPIQGAFEIAEIGNNGKSSSVVPESWIGRRFENADNLHKAMDKLEWRKNKPPVNFCAIYAMTIKTAPKTHSVDELLQNKKLNVKIGISIIVSSIGDNNQILKSTISIFKNKSQYTEWVKLYANLDVLIYNLNTDVIDEKMVIVFNHDDLFERTPVFEKKRSVGLLVSMMQKLLRRGPKCSRALEEVLREIWRSPGYNLPEQQFLRVSACRQLAWRLFVTCIEDIQAYELTKSSNSTDSMLLSMTDLAVLGIIANGQTDIQFNEFIFQKLLLVALCVQKIDTKWEILKNVDTLSEPIPINDTNNDLLNSFIALQNYMPLRQWDHFLITLEF